MTRVYDGPWRTTIRPAILARDNYRCRIQLPGCTGTATEADHIVSIDEGGAWYDPTNLRAACKHCNSTLGAQRTNHKRRSSKPSRDW